MQEPPIDPLIGSTIDDRYLVLSKVARGGMSTVYLAKDVRLNRNIALKILHPHLATDAAFIERLQREAWSAASLSHPHVVQIHDHGVGTEHAYLVLEFIDGHTLRDVIDQGRPMSPRRALDLMDPIVEGLAAAHAAGLVHRDVKPENVLISKTGWVKIGDFGLSRAITATTNTGPLLGTLAYIAPELVNGGGGDARSDIYSAGIMLYELLTGSQPFQGELPIAVAMAHLNNDVPAPSLAVPGLPVEMDELVRYMTEKDPDNRPADGSVLLEDLRHIRRTLSPAELDFGTRAGVAPSIIPRSVTEAATTTVPTAAAEQFTDVMPTAAAGATSVIAAPQFATSVLPSGSQLYVDENVAPDSLPPYGDHDFDDGEEELSAEAAPLSKRAAAAAARAKAKSAAQPTTQLGSSHPRRRATIWAVIIVLLALLGAGAGWFLALGPGALADVPDVHNKTVEQAQALLREDGFKTTSTTQVFDENVTNGMVVASDPGAGTSLRRFQSVTILVSKGPVLYPVPTVTGMLLDAATQALTTGHLAVGAVTEAFDAKVPAGVVLSQDPKSGTELRADSKVNLLVSKGPQPIPVPSVVGKTEADAVAALKAAGLSPEVAAAQVNDPNIPAGSVVAQSPGSGTLFAGGKVTLTISKGPQMVKVPNVVGKQVDDAKKQLEALGFKVAVNNFLGGFFGTVRLQDPAGGEAILGSTITLTIV